MGKVIAKNFRKGRTCEKCKTVIGKAEKYHKKESQGVFKILCEICWFKHDKPKNKVVYSTETDCGGE